MDIFQTLPNIRYANLAFLPPMVKTIQAHLFFLVSIMQNLSFLFFHPWNHHFLVLLFVVHLFFYERVRHIFCFFSHYNKQRFFAKNKDEITILQHNLVRFLHFSPITIDNLNLNPPKNVKIHRKYPC